MVGGMGFRQEKMPAIFTKTLKLKGFAKTERFWGWRDHKTAPHSHLGSAHWIQPTTSLQFVSNFQLEVPDSLFSILEKNLPWDAVLEESTLKPGRAFSVAHVCTFVSPTVGLRAVPHLHVAGEGRWSLHPGGTSLPPKASCREGTHLGSHHSFPINISVFPFVVWSSMAFTVLSGCFYEIHSLQWEGFY